MSPSSSSPMSVPANGLVAELEALSVEGNKAKVRVRKNVFSVWDHPELSLTGWKFDEWLYHTKMDLMPSPARGLFTIDENIVVRGYDKFFNINEVKSTQWDSLEASLSGPFYATLKENGCLVLIAGYDGKLIVTSKHSSGPRPDDNVYHNHARAAKDWVARHLERVGCTEEQLARDLESRKMTAVGELCDDDFEEHILSYANDAAGIYLTGLNYNERKFRTATPDEIQAFAAKYGFHRTEFLEFSDIKPLREFLEERATTGSWAGRHIEGFVVRGHRTSDNADFFFKYKFEEPYLMYRQWRKMLESYLRWLKKPASAPPKPHGLHRASGERFLRFITAYFQSHPEVKDELEANKGKGFLKLREEYLSRAELSEQELVDLGTRQTKWVLVTVATLGCGKTTVSVALEQLYGWGHVQNDSITGAKKPLKLVTKVVDEFAQRDVVILDRNNPMPKERAQIFSDMPELADPLGYDLRYVCLNFLPDGPTGDASAETRKRVASRGDNHQTIRDMTPAKINGIMRDFERRFVPVNPNREPDSNFDLVINLSVGPDSSETNVKTIIDAMAKTYPELDIKIPTPAELRSAVVAAFAYQPKVPGANSDKPATPKAPPLLYIALGVNDENRDLILSKIKQSVPAGLEIVPEFHVTVAHVASHKTAFKSFKQKYRNSFENVNKRDPTKPVWLPLEGSVKVTALCFDDRVAALRVELGEGLESHNLHPHITVAVANGVAPFESNKMLDANHKEIELEPFEVPVKLYAM